MALTNAGRDWIAGAIVDKDPGSAGTPTPYDNTNAAIGVGSRSTAFAASQTDLTATTYGTNKDKRPMEATYPTIAANVLTFRSLYGTGEANYAWAEWAVFNFTAETAPSAGSGEYMLNRKVDALGTKTSAQSWQITVQLTVNAA